MGELHCAAVRVFTTPSELIYIRSVSPNVTTYSESTSGGATETITLGINSNAVQNVSVGLVGSGYQSRAGDVLSVVVYDAGLSGGTETASYTIPSNNASLSSIASGLASAVNADSHLSAIGVTATAASATLSMKSTSNNLTTYKGTVSPTAGAGTETLAPGTNTIGNITVTLGGTVTTGDIVSLNIRAKALTNGQESVGYLVPSGATTTSIAAGLVSAINADANLSSYGITASSAGAVVSISSTPTYSKSTSPGATETITLGTNTNGNVSAAIGGSVTSGDTLTIQTNGAGLSSPQAATYTVHSGDTLTSIAAGLAAQINSLSALKTIGVTAASSAAVVNISNNPINYPAYLSYSTGGATETLSLAMNSNGSQSAVVSGTVTTSDIVGIVTADFGLSGGQESTTYTVRSGDTATSIAAGLASAVNGDTNLQAIGVSATSSGAVLTLNSVSTNVTSYTPSLSSGATETLVLGTNPNGAQTAVVGGTVSSGDVMSLTTYDTGLSSGSELVSYTVHSGDTTSTIASALASAINGDSHLSAIGVTAAAVNNVLNITSTSTNLTTYLQSVSAGATETIALSPGAGVVQSFFNTLNELMATAPGGATSFVGATNKPVKSASASSRILNLQGYQGLNQVLYTLPFPTGYGVGGKVTPGPNNSASVEIDNQSNQAGNQFIFYVNNDNLPLGEVMVSYTTNASDTQATTLAAMCNAVKNNPQLQAIGINASITGSNTFGITVSTPTYSATTSSGATETVSFSPNLTGNAQATIGGKPTTGDTVTLTTSFPSLSGGTESVTYTVLSTDTLESIATGLAALVNADTHLQGIKVSATSATPGTLTSPKNFFVNPNLASGPNGEALAATDGGNNTTTNKYQVSTNNAPSPTLTFDGNGNMTSDGTNTYQWDAENRLTQINYPGSGNYSQLVYDGQNRCVQITEYSGGALTSTKQLVWCGARICEARDASGNPLNQCFSLGQTISNANYYYIFDRLGSVRQVQDSSGNLQATYDYDSFGRVSKTQGYLSSDFQFARYYTHAPSGLNLSRTRAYNARLGRWLNRDPIEENGGSLNLFSYANNNPVSFTDPSGLDPCNCIDWNQVNRARDAGIGAGVLLGAIIGGTGGGYGGGAVAGPGGAYAGVSGGAYSGGFIGGAAGGILFGGANLVGQYCNAMAKGGQGSPANNQGYSKNKQGDNTRKNNQARKALEAAARELGIKGQLSPGLYKQFEMDISGRGLQDYQELYAEAIEFLEAGGY
jgi:RHS repeat-associated protein